MNHHGEDSEADVPSVVEKNFPVAVVGFDCAGDFDPARVPVRLVGPPGIRPAKIGNLF